MSVKYEKVKRYYEKGFWNAEMVRNAVTKGWITADEADEILEKTEETEP